MSAPAKPPDVIQGAVERVVYAAVEGAFTVARLRRPGERDLTTIVGKLVELKEGEQLRLEGHWSFHKKHGRQFEVEHYEVVAPTSADGIERYLGSGLVHGVGPELARRLVRKFGDQTLAVIEGEPKRLLEVDGIGPKRQQQIIDSYASQKGLRELMVFLSPFGVSPTGGSKIHKQYGGGAVSIVRDNPYRLAADIDGIGFRTADRIARNMGIPADSPKRAAAGILHALQELGDEGHVAYPREKLVEAASTMLELPSEQVETALKAQIQADAVVCDDFSGGRRNDDGPPGRSSAVTGSGLQVPDLEPGTRNPEPGTISSPSPALVYLPPLYAAELGVARSLGRIAATPATFPPIDAEAALGWVQERVRIELADGQREAVRRAVASKLSVITGGPGVGKTTIVRCLVEIFRARRLRIALGVPTGRAAKRLAEASGAEAKTVHRLLEYQPRTHTFAVDEREPLEADAVIIDEASMLDLLLTYHLVRAIPPQALLVLVGDVDQLPSVGPGSVLRDIIGSGVATVVRLTDIFRQAASSLIITNAHRINSGQMPELRDPGEAVQRDFFFLYRDDPERAADTILDLCARRLPERYGLDPIDDIQVIAPMHKGAVGAQVLNHRLQERLNPRGAEHTVAGRTFRVGDKVMQIRNNYDKDVYNGDLGRVVAVSPDPVQVVVRIDDREIAYPVNELDEIVPAYAITIHKSQGCEYPAVVVPILTQHYIMLQRNLLYTAVTRGKRLVVLVGTQKAIAIAIRNDRIRERCSHLRERLAGKKEDEEDLDRIDKMDRIDERE